MPAQPMSKNAKIASWVLRIIAAIIFLFPAGAVPKLIGDPYATELFNQLGAGAAGRYAVGVMELAAVVLLLIPKTAFFGGLLGVLIMIGAIGSHLTMLGVVVEFTNVPGASEDNPEANPMLFIMAIVNLVLTGAVAFLHRGDVMGGGKQAGQPPAAA